MNPQKPYRALRAGVGTLAVAAVLALWAAGKLGYAPELGTMWDVVVLVIVLAGGYAVYGETTMSRAVEDAQEIAGDDGDAASSDDEQEGDADAGADA